MLVLSRKKDEQIIVQINDKLVTVRVLLIDGNKVRLGISAPADVAVHREEVWKRKAEFHEPVPAPYVVPVSCEPPSPTVLR